MSKLSGAEKFILLGIPVLFILGSPLHFVYELTGSHFIVGLLVPSNESVFQHTKMVTIPIILWWKIYYLCHKRSLDRDRWFTAAFVSLCAAVISMPGLFYYYSGMFGVELLIVDIFIMLASLLIGQLVGLHFYRHCRGMNFALASALIIAVIVLAAVLTAFPPNIPMFISR